MRATVIKSKLLVVTIVGLISLDANITHAQQKILFLHLRMHEDTIKLVESNVRSGVVKKARTLKKNSGIEYELQSSAGVLLWNGSFEDPSIRRYEYEDPMKPGQLKNKLIRFKDVEFTLRVPFKEGMNQVMFYRSGLVSSSTDMRKSVRKLIAIIELQPERGAQ